MSPDNRSLLADAAVRTELEAIRVGVLIPETVRRPLVLRF
jgi:hypothetical protein